MRNFIILNLVDITIKYKENKKNKQSVDITKKDHDP